MSDSCDSCQVCPHNTTHLTKLGVILTDVDFVVALAGNPNVGKSTVFNNLTGLRQHTGNWPGKTVARAEGGFAYQEKQYKIVDLPGTYSLLSASMDEEIARDFILFGRPDVTLIVVDASRLERNLNLVLQIREITGRAVVCLNLMDEAKRHGLAIDDRALAQDLGVPVVPMVARYGEGMDVLLETIRQVAVGEWPAAPLRIQNHPSALESAVCSLTEKIKETLPGLPNARWVALRLLGGDRRIEEALHSGELAALAQTEREIA